MTETAPAVARCHWSETLPIARLGIWVGSAGFAISLLGVFLALPPLSFGIWNQAEPIFVANHIGAGLAAFGLALLTFRYRQIRHRLVHPFLLVPLALAAWSFFGSFFQKLPWVTVYGSPELGEGVLWYLELAVLIATGLVLKKFRRARLFLVAVAGAVTVIVSVATAISFYVVPFRMIPYFFSDYLAFYAVFLAAIIFGMARPRSGLAVAIVCSAVAAIVIVSNNNAGMAALFGLAPLAWLILSRRKLGVRGARTLGAVGIAAIVLVGTAVEWKVDFESLAKVEGKIGSLANSVVARHHLLKMVGDAIEQDPAILSVGSGWGTFSDHFAIHLPIDWVRTRDDPEARAMFGQKGVWDSVQRVDFHSHNVVSESLIGAGLPGTVLAVFFFAMLPLWSGRRRIPLAGALGAAAGGISVFWFQLPASLSMMALAWAALGGPPPSWSRRLNWRVASTALLIAIGALLLARGVSAYRFAYYAFFYAPSLSAKAEMDGGLRQCPFAFEDEGRGGFHLAHRLRAVTSFTVSRLRDGEPVSDELVAHLRGIICAAEKYIDQNPTSIRLKIAAIAARADLVFAPPYPRIEKIASAYATDWKSRLEEVLREAPRRTDLAAPYLLMLLRDGKEREYRKLADALYRRNPSDPVALWFSGIAMLNDDATAVTGARRMKEALDGGLERLVPVDREVKKRILSESE